MVKHLSDGGNRNQRTRHPLNIGYTIYLYQETIQAL